jgi:PAS domain S-box-containing protein
MGKFENKEIAEYIRKFGSASHFVQKIINSLDCPFAIVDVDTLNIKVTNAENFFVGMKCYDLFECNEGNHDKEKCLVKRVADSKKSLIYRSNNLDASLEIHAHPIFDSSGEVVSVIIYEFNVTHSQSLIESEKKFHSLFNSSPRGMLMYQLMPENNLVLIDANPAIGQILKIDTKKLIGKTIEKTFPYLIGTEISDIFRKVASNGETWQGSEDFCNNKNACGFCEQIAFQISPGVMVVSFNDITEKKESEKILKEKDKIYIKEVEERFYNILQNSQDLVYRYDFRRGSFDYVSESVFTILEYPLSEFMAMNKSDYNKRIHLNDLKLAEDVGDDSEEESTSVVEYRFKKKNGEYIWLRVQRVFFRDKKGELIYSIEDIKDISEEKIIENERTRLKERITHMRSKASETKERVSLTDREKLVLWGFCRYSLLNDEELANKLGLKRSTLTAIKNRLKGKNWFSLNYIPNFCKLSCQFFTIFDANFKGDKGRGLDLVKKNLNVVMSNYQDDKLLAGFTSDKYVDIKRFLEQVADINGLKHRINENSFFYDLDDVFLYDVSGLVNSLFGLNRKERPTVYKFKNGAESLSINEKRVLHAVIKDPGMSSAEIAKKIWTSKPTVIKVKKKLLDEDYIYPYVSLDFRKMGFLYMARFSFEFDSDSSMWANKESRDVRVVLRIVGKKRMTKIMLFASEEEYEEEVDVIKGVYRKKGIDFKLNSAVFPIQKRKSTSSKMESFISDRLFGDEL